MEPKTLYERDFQSWIEHNIILLKQHQFAEIEIETLVEELEYMAKKDKHELVNHLMILIAHLLKWQFQFKQLTDLWQTFRGSSWQASIAEQRKQIIRQLKMSPSLKTFLTDAVSEAYPDAVDLAIRDTKLSLATFPQSCPYTLEQLLDENFFP